MWRYQMGLMQNTPLHQKICVSSFRIIYHSKVIELTYSSIPLTKLITDACTIPFSCCTAALGFYQRLNLPFPTSSLSTIVQSPLIIYGAATAIGAFSLKLAGLGTFSKIITICGQGTAFVSSLNVATHIIDYRGNDVVSAIKLALDGDKCYHAVDAMNSPTSIAVLREVVEPYGGKISVYLPREDYSSIPKGIFVGITYFGTVHGKQTHVMEQQYPEDIDFGYSFFHMLPRWLRDGKITGHPYEILPHGLSSVGDALRMLKEGNVSAKKFIFRLVKLLEIRGGLLILKYRVSDTPSILERDQTKLPDGEIPNGYEMVVSKGWSKGTACSDL